MLGNLTLDQLRVLIAVADSGSFSAAARSLGRAQSAISQMVATLEASQGVALFDRTGWIARADPMSACSIICRPIALRSSRGELPNEQ